VKPEKRTALEADGWRIGDSQDFVEEVLSGTGKGASVINIQVRTIRDVSTRGMWIDYGDVGFIQAAKTHAIESELPDKSAVEVRDGNDPTRPNAIFELKRVVSYEVLNPRQGAE
jgi:hypothetical protein